VETLDANGTTSDDFASGQQITFRMTAQNVSSQPQTFNIQPCFGPAAYEVFRSGSSDAVVAGYMKQGVECESLEKGGTPTTLAPGESVKADVIWTQAITGGQLAFPGTYSVVAGIACVQSDACMPHSVPAGAVPLSDTAIYRSEAMSFTIKP
jgi:hypothetical protein